MAFITMDDKVRIITAIADAERRTAGEIVCIVSRSASSYVYVPIVWAAILALALPWGLIRFTMLGIETIHLIQLAGFVVLAAVLCLLPLRLRMAMTPGFIKRHRAARAAREQFFANDLVQTVGRTGCLIYVSEAEHHAEVLADEGIASKVSPEVWKQAITVLTDALSAGRTADGFVAAIALCGAVLAEHVPPREGDINELPNRLIML
jgi:putative membrane protein